MNYCSQVSRLDKYTQKRDPFSTELLNAVKTEQEQQQKKEKHVDYWKEKKKKQLWNVGLFCEMRRKDIHVFTQSLTYQRAELELFSSTADAIQ